MVEVKRFLDDDFSHALKVSNDKMEHEELSFQMDKMGTEEFFNTEVIDWCPF